MITTSKAFVQPVLVSCFQRRVVRWGSRRKISSSAPCMARQLIVQATGCVPTHRLQVKVPALRDESRSSRANELNSVTANWHADVLEQASSVLPSVVTSLAWQSPCRGKFSQYPVQFVTTLLRVQSGPSSNVVSLFA